MKLRGLFGLPDAGTFCAVVAASFLLGELAQEMVRRSRV